MKDTVSSLVTFVLMLALLYVLWIAFAVGQTRYLTIDEFQWGHATWLVSQGEVPYRDFYEHHLPLGYVLHSVFLNGDGSFIDKTLLLRTIAFAYLLAAAAMLGSATWVTRRDLNESLLAALLPIGIGFGLMSAIEYRGDNWSAVGLLLCAGLLEMARKSKQPRLSLAAGALFSIAVLMTQKILVLGGGVLLLMLIAGFVRRRGGSGAAGESRWTPRARSLAVPYPCHFCLGAGLVVLAGLAWAGSLGILGDAFEINVSQAIEHERLYPGFDFRQYVDPFLTSAPISSALLVLLAVAYLASVTAPFWIALLLAAALGGANVTAPYPYNFVLACFLLGLCAARGCGTIVRWASQRAGRAAEWAPVLYLAPLLLLPAQLGFVSGTTSNQHQLALLSKIEALSDEDEVVIDSAGSALFRPHRSYYWYQGRASVVMFADYFENDLLDDLRASQALFWIQSRRFRQLPADVRTYLLSHYLRFDQDLRVLGFSVPHGANDEALVQQIDVVRAGDYHLSLHPRSAADQLAGRESPWREDLAIDGSPVTADSVHLEAGLHRIERREGSPSYRLSFLPPETFGRWKIERPHTMLFEFDPSKRP
jgi:hypothetical protein